MLLQDGATAANEDVNDQSDGDTAFKDAIVSAKCSREIAGGEF